MTYDGKMKPVDNRRFSSETNAVLRFLKRDDTERAEARVWTQKEMLKVCGGDRAWLVRSMRCLRLCGWVEGRPGKKSGRWYFRLTDAGRRAQLLSSLDDADPTSFAFPLSDGSV